MTSQSVSFSGLKFSSLISIFLSTFVTGMTLSIEKGRLAIRIGIGSNLKLVQEGMRGLKSQGKGFRQYHPVSRLPKSMTGKQQQRHTMMYNQAR